MLGTKPVPIRTIGFSYVDYQQLIVIIRENCVPKSRQDHKSLVKKLIDHFVSNGLEIQYANYDGYEKPFVITRHAPDVIAFDRAKQLGYIGEAEMCNEITEQLTKEKFEDFSKKLMRGGKSERARLPFFIAVPHECNSRIPQTLRDLGINERDNIHVLSF